ncbi:hypothetical protein HMPREF9148_00965, partial [Prevotella sp. F0091]
GRCSKPAELNAPYFCKASAKVRKVFYSRKQMVNNLVENVI